MATFANIMITPKGEVDVEFSDKVYYHPKFFALPVKNPDDKIDLQLHDGIYIHTRDVENDGTYLLYHKKIID